MRKAVSVDVSGKSVVARIAPKKRVGFNSPMNYLVE